MKQVIVIGASGNLGKGLTFQLSENGYQVIALTRSESLPKHKSIIEISGEFNSEDLIAQVENYLKIDQLHFVVSTVGSFSNLSYEETTVSLLLVQVANNVGSNHGICKMIASKANNKNRKVNFLFIGAKSALDYKTAVQYPAYNLAKILLIHYAQILTEFLTNKQSSIVVIAPKTITNQETDDAENVTVSRLIQLIFRNIISNTQIENGFSIKTINNNQLVEFKS